MLSLNFKRIIPKPCAHWILKFKIIIKIDNNERCHFKQKIVMKLSVTNGNGAQQGITLNFDLMRTQKWRNRKNLILYYKNDNFFLLFKKNHFIRSCLNFRYKWSMCSIGELATRKIHTIEYTYFLFLQS